MLFDQQFSLSLNTRLVKGGHEPEYIPTASPSFPHQIIFAHDYFSSALHEIAHWCVAGEKRRQQYDYGYWYEPDGRTLEQQAEFEKVEVKPQALEWLFSTACGVHFRVSTDNLSQEVGPSESFKNAIVRQAHHYCEHGVNQRATLFLQVLLEYYQTINSFNELFDKRRYSVSQL